MLRITVFALIMQCVNSCAIWEECYGPSSKDWPLEAPRNKLTRCCTHMSPTTDLNSTDICKNTLISKGHYYYGRCCSDWGICDIPPAPSPPAPFPPAPLPPPPSPAFGTCGFACETDDDCKDCGGGRGGHCAKPYGDNNALLKALTASCVETSSSNPPTEPKADYRIGVQPLQHYADLRIVEYESFADDVNFAFGNIHYDGTENRLRHDWSEYLGQGKQTQIYLNNARYYIVLKNGICIDFVMRENLPAGRKVGIPSRNWLNTCANTTGNLVYVGRELVNGEWADHFACYVVVSHNGENTTIAFQNWHSLGLGTTKLGQPLRVAGSNSRPRKMPPDARMTTMFYFNVSDGPTAVPASVFDIPRGCLRVGADQAYTLAAEEITLAHPAASDLQRAQQRVPRSSFRGKSLGAAMVKLNKLLLADDKLQTRICAAHSLQELHETQRVLFAVRSHELQLAYPQSDRRYLQYESASTLLEAQTQQLAEAQARPDLIHLIRDGLCHEIVMMYAHHLSETVRTKLRARASVVLPLLPEHEAHPAPVAGDGLANKTYSGYVEQTGCLVCHVDPQEVAVV